MYNEEVFSSLDWILDQASQRGIHLILPIEVQLLTSPTHAGRERCNISVLSLTTT